MHAAGRRPRVPKKDGSPTPFVQRPQTPARWNTIGSEIIEREFSDLPLVKLNRKCQRRVDMFRAAHPEESTRGRSCRRAWSDNQIRADKRHAQC